MTHVSKATVNEQYAAALPCFGVSAVAWGTPLLPHKLRHPDTLECPGNKAGNPLRLGSIGYQATLAPTGTKGRTRGGLWAEKLMTRWRGVRRGMGKITYPDAQEQTPGLASVQVCKCGDTWWSLRGTEELGYSAPPHSCPPTAPPDTCQVREAEEQCLLDTKDGTARVSRLTTCVDGHVLA